MGRAHSTIVDSDAQSTPKPELPRSAANADSADSTLDLASEQLQRKVKVPTQALSTDTPPLHDISDSALRRQVIFGKNVQTPENPDSTLRTQPIPASSQQTRDIAGSIEQSPDIQDTSGTAQKSRLYRFLGLAKLNHHPATPRSSLVTDLLIAVFCFAGLHAIYQGGVHLTPHNTLAFDSSLLVLVLCLSVSGIYNPKSLRSLNGELTILTISWLGAFAAIALMGYFTQSAAGAAYQVVLTTPMLATLLALYAIRMLRSTQLTHNIKVGSKNIILCGSRSAVDSVLRRIDYSANPAVNVVSVFEYSGTNDKTTHGNTTQDKATQDNASQGKVTLGKAIQAKATQDKATQDKATQDKATKGKATQGKVPQGISTQEKYNPAPGQLADVAEQMTTFVESQRQAGLPVDQVWIAGSVDQNQVSDELSQYFLDSSVDVCIAGNQLADRLLAGEMTRLADTHVVNVSQVTLSPAAARFKRVFDVIAASGALLIFGIPMLLIACLVKLETPGPVLFKQKRYGVDGEEVGVLKFRSMRVHSDAHVRQATRNDDRITRIGKVLRSTSLDELPQLFNVMCGSMSLIGPRPHAVAHNEMWRKQINGYMMRHKVRPGITGLAQVKGWRGETDTLYKMEQRVHFDLEYIKNWSLWLDIKILLLTVVKGFRNENAY